MRVERDGREFDFEFVKVEGREFCGCVCFVCFLLCFISAENLKVEKNFKAGELFGNWWETIGGRAYFSF